MIDCISEGLYSLLLIELAFDTQNFPFFGIKSSQHSSFVFSKSSSYVLAWMHPTLIKIRSAVRKKIFASATARASPQKNTRPSRTRLTS